MTSERAHAQNRGKKPISGARFNWEGTKNNSLATNERGIFLAAPRCRPSKGGHADTRHELECPNAD